MEGIFLWKKVEKMNILNITKLQKEFSGDILFTNVSFDINSKDKVAIIGKNGTGKTTLLRMILGDEEIDQGDIFWNPKAKIGYLSQNVISSKIQTLYEEMHDVFSALIALEKKLHAITEQVANDPENSELLQTYANIEHDYEIKGGYEYLYKIDLILSKFGFKKEEYHRKISTFSGGEKTRVAFAKLLLMEPDLLILDEPTNHLDIEIIEWLEDYLNKYNGAVLIVTHDKYFISKVCRKMVELDQQTSHIYYGTFSEYEEEKIKRYEQLLRRYNRQQKEIAHLQSFIDRFRYNSKRASIAKDRQKKIDRMNKIDKPHQSKRKIKLAFDEKRTTRDIILEAKQLSFGYDKPLLQDVSFHMRGYDKLAIIGPNGTGKTTLLKVIEKKLKPLSGKIHFLRDYNIGYFDQNQEDLHMHKTIYEEIHDYYPIITNKEVRHIAARFLFYNEDLDKPIHILSGGEKVRLVLLLLMLSNPDLLILDEPTNHLDIETKDIVEDVFSEFSGPIIFVSHDRYFINKIGTKLIHLNENGYEEFNGTYDEFKEYKSNQVIKNDKRQKKNKEKKVNTTKKIQQLEAAIVQVEDKIKAKEADTFKEEFYQDIHKIRQLNEEINDLRHDLELLFEEYYQFAEDLRGDNNEE